MKLRHLAFLAASMIGLGPAPATDPVSHAIEWKNGPKGDLTFEELQDALIEAELKLERCGRG